MKIKKIRIKAERARLTRQPISFVVAIVCVPVPVRARSSFDCCVVLREAKMYFTGYVTENKFDRRVSGRTRTLSTPMH